jgi:hypothetical protein
MDFTSTDTHDNSDLPDLIGPLMTVDDSLSLFSLGRDAIIVVIKEMVRGQTEGNLDPITKFVFS